MEASLHDQTPFIKYPGSRDGAACCGRDCAGGSGGLERGTVERGETVAASAGHTQCHARQDRRACAAQEPGGSFACKSRRLPISCRRRQRSRPERATSGVRNSRTTAGRSSIDTSSVLRRTTATASCAAVKVVCNRCGVWLRSCTLSRCFHLYMVCPFVGKTIHWIVF